MNIVPPFESLRKDDLNIFQMNAEIRQIISKLTSEEYSALSSHIIATDAAAKSAWTAEEDSRLQELINQHGSNWRKIACNLKGRTSKQCRERYASHLSPAEMNGPWTPEEDRQLESLVSHFGTRWLKINAFFPLRTDSNLKNRWISILRKMPNVGQQKPMKVIKNPKESMSDATFRAHQSDVEWFL